MQITPVSSPDNHFIKLSVDSKIDVEGNIKGVIKLVAEGQSDSSFRSRYVNSRQSEWKNITERILLSSDSRMIIDSVKYDNPYNYSNPFELYVEFNIPSYSNVYGSEYIFHSLAMNLFKSKFSHLYLDSSIKTRKNGFKDRCSRLITISESIEFPQTVKIAYSPDSISYNSNSASVNAVYTTIDNKLNLDFRIKLEKRLYSREEWPDVRKVVLSHKEFINNPVILNYR